jgi:DNA-binding transcriptional MerR regulator
LGVVLQDSGDQNDERGPEAVDIPDKVYFKIGEVSEITGIEPHVLRYWESEIKVIRPQRATSKQRLYRRADIERILTVKKLLQEEGYTISGAKKYLTGSRKNREMAPEAPRVTVAPGTTGAPSPSGMPRFYHEIKAELEEIKKLLETKL